MSEHIKQHLLFMVLIYGLALISGQAQANQPASPAQLTQQAPTPDEVQKWSFEKRAQYYASQYLENLPDFIVNQQIKRMQHSQGNKDWQVVDDLVIELTYTAKKGDVYKLLKQNGKPVKRKYDPSLGATSMGEFGEIMALLFKARFLKSRQDNFRNRPALALDYVIEKADAKYQLTESTTRQQITTGLEGTVWIDAQSARILRIEYSASNIPAEFPLSVAEHAIDYREITVKGKQYLLPNTAEFLVGNERNNFYQRNYIEFLNYRVFDTDLKISIEEEPVKKNP